MKIWVVALLLSGCAAQEHYADGNWVDYRAMMIEKIARSTMSGPGKDVPYSVVNAYAECATDYLLSYTSPEDKAMLDAYAQQKIALTQAESDAYEQRLKDAGAQVIAYTNVGPLAGTCPDKVPLFKQHFH
jgi:hypothetical protein